METPLEKTTNLQSIPCTVTQWGSLLYAVGSVVYSYGEEKKPVHHHSVSIQGLAADDGIRDDGGFNVAIYDAEGGVFFWTMVPEIEGPRYMHVSKANTKWQQPLAVCKIPLEFRAIITSMTWMPGGQICLGMPSFAVVKAAMVKMC